MPGPSTRTSPFTQLPLYCYEKGRRSSVPTTPPRCTPLRIMLSPPRMFAVYRLPTTFKVADAQSLPVFGSLICSPD